MTISASNASAAAPPRAELAEREAAPPAAAVAAASAAPPARTLWSRFIILMLCLAVVLTTLAFGTVHGWSIAAFQLSAGIVFVLWMMDALRTGVLRVSRSPLQLPLVGLFALGSVQLLGSVSFDPHATRDALAQIAALGVYFAAALAFIDSPRRLRLVVRLVVIFGFVLAVYGLMQHFVNPATIFWVREPKQALPFGPYVNRHHFAGYMELTLAVPLGLLFAGAIPKERMLLYGFASGIMAIALIMTNSRGGVLSMMAEVMFLAIVAATALRRRRRGEEDRATRARATLVRLGLGFALIIAVVLGALYFGGEEALSRLVGTVNSDDPTTGRAHFWSGTVDIIRDHPLLGAGLGGFAAAYTLYDTGNGMYRLEQAHNDYLQILSDGGALGGALGLAFVGLLFWTALRRMQSHDKYRRGVALGALSGCAGVLVHSFFDFTLHTTANALCFLVLAALATVNGRVEEEPLQDEPQLRRRRRRSRRGTGSFAGTSHVAHRPADAPAPAPEPAPAAEGAAGGEGAAG
jgi:O-antigen ligase